MTETPSLSRLVAALPPTVPFVPPEALERARGLPFRARLGANENGFAPSPLVLEAIGQAAGDMWKYPDPTAHDLKAALAKHHGVEPENVAIGEGIDGLLGEIVRLWSEPDAPVVTSLGAYPTFNYHVAAHGRRLVPVPYRDDREDWRGLLQAVESARARLVYFSNPDNPMGTWWGVDEVQELINALPRETLLILDEAYIETAFETRPLELDPGRPNVLRLRTFSKAYGLAGLRLGYAIGHSSAIAAFDKVRNHFGVNRMAQAVGLAALADQEHLAGTVIRIARARGRIAAIAEANGLNAIPSATNFVAVDCGRDGPFALRVLQVLAEHGVFVRKPAAPGLDRCIRISTAPDNELAVLAEALPLALAAARA